METVNGKIKSYDETGAVVVVATYHDTERWLRRNYKECLIVLKDSRTISHEQRKKAYALLNEISDYMGELPEYVKKLFKLKFIHDQMKGLADEIFSLSDCDVTTAKEFITYLVEFIIAHDIPTKVPLVELCEDVKQYVYACALNKKCAVCGKKAELHHIDKIGMGNDRTEVSHLGRKALPLCREHHGEMHDFPVEEFLEKYHLQPIKIDDKLCKKWRLKQ